MISFEEAYSAEWLNELLEQRGPFGWLHWREPERFNPGRGPCAVIKGRKGTLLYFEGTGRRVLAAKVVWRMVTGEWPQNRILRRNGDVYDDRFANLYVKGEPDHRADDLV
jgi:hypothetical protein